MIGVRRGAERGHTRTDWLDSRHSFSFGDYRDPRHAGFRDLRVINEDRVQPGQGFAPHSHRDMEIVTWVLTGALEHRDSLGNGSRIRPGDVQRMSAGTGVTHSEYNPSRDEPVHFVQIWILPERAGLPPSYEQKSFPEEELGRGWRLVAAPNGAEGSLRLHQDARILAARPAAGAQLEAGLRPDRYAWLQVTRGAVELGSERLAAGDGAALHDEPHLPVRAAEPSELLLFDLG